MSPQENLITKINSLPPERLAEVVDFVEHISNRDATRLRRAERNAALHSFALEFGGTSLDLDPQLEAAGIESLLASIENPK